MGGYSGRFAPAQWTAPAPASPAFRALYGHLRVQGRRSAEQPQTQPLSLRGIDDLQGAFSGGEVKGKRLGCVVMSAGRRTVRSVVVVFRSVPIRNCAPYGLLEANIGNRQSRQMGEQFVPQLLRNGLGFLQGEVWVNLNSYLGVELVPVPPRLHVGHRADARNVLGDVTYFIQRPRAPARPASA